MGWKLDYFENRKKRYIIFGVIVIFLLIFIYFFILNPLTFWAVNEVELHFYNCDNVVDYYYSGDGLFIDIDNFYAEEGINFNGNLIDKITLQQPYSSHFDCNDATAIIYCLAKEYDIKCTRSFNMRFNEPDTHYIDFPNYRFHFITYCDDYPYGYIVYGGS